MPLLKLFSISLCNFYSVTVSFFLFFQMISNIKSGIKWIFKQAGPFGAGPYSFNCSMIFCYMATSHYDGSLCSSTLSDVAAMVARMIFLLSRSSAPPPHPIENAGQNIMKSMKRRYLCEYPPPIPYLYLTSKGTRKPTSNVDVGALRKR